MANYDQNDNELLALLLEGKLDPKSRKAMLLRIASDNELAMIYGLSRILLGLPRDEGEGER